MIRPVTTDGQSVSRQSARRTAEMMSSDLCQRTGYERGNGVDVGLKLRQQLMPRTKPEQRRRWARWSLVISVLVPMAQSPASGPAAFWHGAPGAQGAAGSTDGAAAAATAQTVGTAYAPLTRTGWTATADSQETAAVNGAAANAIDGNATTFWISRYTPAPAVALPHWLTVDMKSSQRIAGLTYQPRPAASRNGDIGQYRIAISNNNIAWTTVASGTWADD